MTGFRRFFEELLERSKHVPKPWTGFPVPASPPRTFDDLDALLPDVIPPPSALAKRAAWVFISSGSSRGIMKIHPDLVQQAQTIQICFGLCRNYAETAPGFVVMPIVKFLLDAWCVEDKDTRS